MANVTNPARLGSVQAVFGGPGNLRAYNRGGSYVPSGPAENNNISTNADSLRLSTFAGATDVVVIPFTASLTPPSATETTGLGTQTTLELYYNPVYSGGTGTYSIVSVTADYPATATIINPTTIRVSCTGRNTAYEGSVTAQLTDGVTTVSASAYWYFQYGIVA